MQTAEVGLRYGSGTLPNVNYTVPRRSDVAWLSANRYAKSRLPIVWEMLQPVLLGTNANAATRAIVGEPGAFNAMYESFVTGLLDAHAAAGVKCVLDLHNYCRYRDFIYQSDGSVKGLVKPADPQIYPYTSDATQVRTRIFATAPGATLTPAQFVDFWTRAARKWKDHPGLGGYGLMNEPYNLPAPGTITESFSGNEDLLIWPTFAQAAIDAIRTIDPNTPIYLDSNGYSAAFTIGTQNPAWPLRGTNLIYEVHMYLDAGSSGQRYDYDAEVARNFSVGEGRVPINLDTGVARLRPAVDWAKSRGVRLALSETGMPIDDPRWQEMYQRMLNFAISNGVEVFSWNGGSHWLSHNLGINHVPGWHQNKTLEPQMSGPMKLAIGVSQATVFADGPGWAPGGAPVTITVYTRGNLGAAATLAVTSNNGGTFSKSTLTLAAGANTQDTFTFTPGANRVTTLSFAVTAGALEAPPARKVYSLTDPVAYAATSLQDAAMAIVAKYSACKWELADGYTDDELGGPAAAGQPVRAISDSGYGSSPGNAMEMLNTINTDTAFTGGLTVPTMRVTNGKKNSDHSATNTAGFWCRKTIPLPEAEPNPRNRIPYALQDPHFSLIALSVPGAGNSGIAFQTSQAGHVIASQITFSNSQPQASVTDVTGASVTLTSPAKLAANTPAVVTLTSVPGAQRLRVNSTVVGSGAATFSNSPCDQMLIGWGYLEYFPRPGFGGNVYAVITGKGAPTTTELEVLERYLASTAGG